MTEQPADEEAERRRVGQLAAMAQHAITPFLDEWEESVITRLLSYADARDEIPVEKVWIAVGQLAASRKIKQNLAKQKRQGEADFVMPKYARRTNV